MTAQDILARLVAFPSVVGTGNAGIVEWIRSLLQAEGVPVTVLPGPEGDRSNLFATIGPAGEPGLILSGHMDVVPADELGWTSDPFRLRDDGGRLFGRGTSDMKGFLAAVLAAVPWIVARAPRRPIHLAFSYDEEAGCRGVPHLIARLGELCAPPAGAVIGEPSGLRPILAHKGKAAARILVRGRTGHSSRPDLGLNAIHGMVPVLAAATAAAEAARKAACDPSFEPPYSTLQVGRLVGGEALNVIPANCTAEVEARAVAGVSPLDLLAPIRAALAGVEAQGFETGWEPLSDYPALALSPEAPLARLLTEVTRLTPLAAVSYGTEAGLYQAAGVDAIICGPGDIGRAHKPNEYIEAEELAACERMIIDLVERFGA
jgi:acetylornithine deacetylase